MFKSQLCGLLELKINGILPYHNGFTAQRKRNWWNIHLFIKEFTPYWQSSLEIINKEIKSSSKTPLRRELCKSHKNIELNKEKYLVECCYIKKPL